MESIEPSGYLGFCNDTFYYIADRGKRFSSPHLLAYNRKTLFQAVVIIIFIKRMPLNSAMLRSCVFFCPNKLSNLT